MTALPDIAPKKRMSPAPSKAHRLPPLAPPARAASFDHPVRLALVRPALTKRRYPDLTGFFAGAVVLTLALFLVTAAGSHVQDRAAETVAQSIARSAM